MIWLKFSYFSLWSASLSRSLSSSPQRMVNSLVHQCWIVLLYWQPSGKTSQTPPNAISVSLFSPQSFDVHILQCTTLYRSLPFWLFVTAYTEDFKCFVPLHKTHWTEKVIDAPYMFCYWLCLFIPCLKARAPSYVLKWVSKQLRGKGLLAGDWRSVSREEKILIWYTTVVMKQLSWLVGLRELWIPKMHQGQYIIGCSRTWKLWGKKWICHVWNYLYELVMVCRLHFHYSWLNCCCAGPRKSRSDKIKEGIEW